jgi:hypothetical protein
MRFSVRLYAILVLFLAACTLALADPEVHTTLALDVRTRISPDQRIELTAAQELHQDNSHAQRPLAAPYSVSSYAYAKSQPMQAASEAGSAERPIGKIAFAVVISGVLFGLGMGM